MNWIAHGHSSETSWEAEQTLLKVADCPSHKRGQEITADDVFKWLEVFFQRLDMVGPLTGEAAYEGHMRSMWLCLGKPGEF